MNSPPWLVTTLTADVPFLLLKPFQPIITACRSGFEIKMYSGMMHAAVGDLKVGIVSLCVTKQNESMMRLLTFPEYTLG